MKFVAGGASGGGLDGSLGHSCWRWPKGWPPALAGPAGLLQAGV